MLTIDYFFHQRKSEKPIDFMVYRRFCFSIALISTLLGGGNGAFGQTSNTTGAQWRESTDVSSGGFAASNPQRSQGGNAVQQTGAWLEPFESPAVSWEKVGSDAQYQISRHERTTAEKHSGNMAERITVNANRGTYIYMAHPVGKPRVISELEFKVWVKSNRSGIQALARVVLPHTIDPRNKKPVVTLLSGTSYNQTGRWQALSIRDLPNLLKRNALALRLQLRSDVDTREAYVDRIYLNLFGGPGMTDVLIDDLTIAGHVELPLVGTNPSRSGFGAGSSMPTTHMPHQSFGASAAIAPSQATSSGQSTAVQGNADQTTKSKSSSRVELVGDHLRIDGRPVLVRAIRYRGEPLSMIKQLGFNSVWIDTPPTDTFLREIESVGLNLISPPPKSVSQMPNTPQAGENPGPKINIGDNYSPVIAWSLGWGLGGDQVGMVRDLARKIRAADSNNSRPLVCPSSDNLRALSSTADLMLIDHAPLGTSIELKDYGTWLKSRALLARLGRLLWTTVQTEPSPELIRQWFAMDKGFGSLPPQISYEQIRLAAFTAITSGSRGLLFESHQSLTNNDNSTRLRRLSLELVNRELEMIEPFVAGRKLGRYRCRRSPGSGRRTVQIQSMPVAGPALGRAGGTICPGWYVRRSGLVHCAGGSGIEPCL